MTKRVRSESETEERAITEYIRTCTEFRTNVTFTDIQTISTTTPVAPCVLLIGTLAELKDKSVEALPIYCGALANAIASIEEGSCMETLAALHNNETYTRIIISALSSKASRTNCPYRPDLVTDAVSKAMKGMKKDSFDVYVRAPAGAEVAMANGIARGSRHSFTAAKNAAQKAYVSSQVKINVIFSSRAAFTGEAVDGRTITVPELEAICTSVQLCQRLVDSPTCLLDTVVFAEIAEHYGRELGVSVDIIKGEDLRERGYGGMYGVGKCAQYPPHLVTLHYHNDQAPSGKNIALVGKGIVYDCGGLALKPAIHMTNMKTDMGGAAAVFAGFVATVRCIKAQKSHYTNIANLSVTLCLAENAIGPNAFRNDDILVMKSGKTVEVINTDAEGRLVLGDGVFHATNEQSFIPDILIDMATLTGAQGIATGKHHAALYVNDGPTESDVMKAGIRSGDTCFPVLYCPEYHNPEYESPCADMRNLMTVVNNASVSCAGEFVANHLSERFKGAHVHVDLAFPSSDANGGTGFGVNLITEYLKKF